MEGIEQLSRIDLNLLVIFRVMDELKHVTRAAKALGLTQPAMSHALKRLREAFGDPLFVKSSQGMVLTPLAESLSRPIREILQRLGQEVLGRGTFSPEQLRRVFRVRTTDLIESLLVHKLVQAFGEKAPGVQLAVLPTGFGLPKVELERGETDLAIAGFFGDLPDGFYQQHLFSDSFVCAVAKGHPRIKDGAGISVDQYCRERHILVAPSGDLTGIVDRELKKRKKSRTVAAGLSSFMTSGCVTANSDCVLTAPTRLVKQFESYFPMRVFPPPIRLPEIKIVQVWHERNHQDPAHKWFREAVKQTLL